MLYLICKDGLRSGSASTCASARKKACASDKWFDSKVCKCMEKYAKSRTAMQKYSTLYNSQQKFDKIFKTKQRNAKV